MGHFREAMETLSEVAGWDFCQPVSPSPVSLELLNAWQSLPPSISTPEPQYSGGMEWQVKKIWVQNQFYHFLAARSWAHLASPGLSFLSLGWRH